VVVQHSLINLTCQDPKDKISQISFASYGKPTGNSFANFEQQDCHASNSLAVVEKYCL